MMDMMKMMQQAKQMQDKMQQMQADLENVEVTGSAGGGMVTTTMTCKGVMRDIKIAPEVIDPSDPDMLQDLIIAAVNDAKAKAETRSAEEMKQLTEGLPLPPGMKLPF